jgi:uncharacterized protein with ATP-grasp and redox domains
MRTYLECIPCFVRQGLDALREVCTDEAEIDRILKQVLSVIAGVDRQQTPPEMSRAIHGLIRHELGNVDPYHEIKQCSTRQALEVMPEVRRRIERSDKPFDTAVRFALAGNILDFALASLYQSDQLDTTLARAETQPLDEAMVTQLQHAVDQAQTILWLADNAGETVFDRLLIEQLTDKRFIYAVKAAPIINDATLSDAQAAGVHEVADIIDNGTDAPGTVLKLCSPGFRDIFQNADLVIAKGQANFETLNEVDREIYFLTQIKCVVMARHYGYRIGDWVVTTTTAIASRMQSNQPEVAHDPG